MHKNKIKVLIYISFFLVILLRGLYIYTKYKSDDEKKEYELFIEELKDVTEDKISYYTRIYKSNDKFILNIYNDKYSNKVDLSKYKELKYGDVIKVCGKIIIPQKLNNPRRI